MRPVTVGILVALLLTAVHAQVRLDLRGRSAVLLLQLG